MRLLFLTAVTSCLITSCVTQPSVQITSPQERDIQVAYGSKLIITCEMDSGSLIQLGPAQIFWEKSEFSTPNDIERLATDGHYVIERTILTTGRLASRLTIYNMTYDDEGIYECVGELNGDNMLDSIYIYVTGRPVIADIYRDVEPIAGGEVTLTCLVQGRPEPTVQWRAPSNQPVAQFVTSYSTSTSSLSDVMVRSVLTLYKLTSDSRGEYRCLARNGNGTASDSVNIQFIPLASISQSGYDVYNTSDRSAMVTSLGYVSLDCTAYNVPDNVEVAWQFYADSWNAQGFREISQTDKYVITLTSNPTPDPEFFNVTSQLQFKGGFSDQGIYRCLVIQNGGKIATMSRELQIEGVPTLEVSPRSVEASIGMTFNFTCTAQSRPPLQNIYWARDGIRMPSTSYPVDKYSKQMTTVISVSSRSVFSVQYSCWAENILGTNSVSLEIRDLDECATDICENFGSGLLCENNVGSYRCVCPIGYIRDVFGNCVDPTNTEPYSSTHPPPLTPIIKITTTTGPTPFPTTPTPTPTDDDTQPPYNEEENRNDNDGGSSSSNVGLYAGVGGAVVGIIVIIIIIVVVVRLRRKPQSSEPRPARVENPKYSTQFSGTYANPAYSTTSEDHNYTHLNRDPMEFPRERLRMETKLGSGKFGTVYMALALSIQSTGKWDRVAVKMMKEAATDAEKADFLRELSLLRSLPRHPHVVTLLGCCTRSDPTLIIMEYCEQGDLMTYLRKRRPGNQAFPGNAPSSDLSARDLFTFALHTARGMAHIAAHKIVHRDVATRNILLTDRNVCKVSDLGLARYIDDSDVYELVSRRPLPLRWMAPESLRDGVHTTQSDVWSYGVLLWEIVTLGASPFPGMTGKSVMDCVISGTRLEIPPQCSQELSTIMTSCWAMKPDERPSFDVIAGHFERLLESEGDYLLLDNLGEGIYQILEPSASGERV